MSLRQEVGLYFTAAAECYEGWTLFAFMSLLRLYLVRRNRLQRRARQLCLT